MNPFLPFETKNLVKKIMELDEFKEYNFTKKELLEAAEKAEAEYQKCKKDIRDKGSETVRYIEENNLRGIVLAGRPYHIDPDKNRQIPTHTTNMPRTNEQNDRQQNRFEKEYTESSDSNIRCDR